MRATISLLTIALSAGVAFAEPATVPAQTAPPAPSSDKSSPTVSGVTVMPLPRKPCAPKDKACIALVIAEVKDLYPDQLKQFCFQQQMDVMRQDMQANMAGWCEGPGLGASAICSHHLPPVVKQVCTTDKQDKK